MSEKEEKKRVLAYHPWALILAAGKLPMTAAERHEYNRRLHRGFRPELPPFDPADLLDMEKVPWPDEIRLPDKK